MGQIVVGSAMFLSITYLVVRRSMTVALAAFAGVFLLVLGIFLFIQALKTRLDVTLFFLLATGIPVSAIYSIFVAALIWIQLENRDGNPTPSQAA